MKKLHPFAHLAALAAIGAIAAAGCTSDAGASASGSTQAPVDPAIQADQSIPDPLKAQASEQFSKVPEEYRSRIPQGGPIAPQGN